MPDSLWLPGIGDILPLFSLKDPLLVLIQSVNALLLSDGIHLFEGVDGGNDDPGRTVDPQDGGIEGHVVGIGPAPFFIGIVVVIALPLLVLLSAELHGLLPALKNGIGLGMGLHSLPFEVIAGMDKDIYLAFLFLVLISYFLLLI